jgi:biopolymer transport protein ExbB
MLRWCLYGSTGLRLRLLTFTALAWAILWGALAFQGSLRAQEPGAEAPAAAPPAAQPAAPAAAPAPAPSGEAAPQMSLLRFYFKALGVFYTVVFLGLSFALVALVVMNLLAARRENMVPMALVEGFEAYLNEKKYQEAYELARNDESFLGKVLSAGLAKLSAGYAQAMEAMQEVGEEETMKAEHRLSYIALIGTISPMVGLLGTVDGMVASFRVIATSPTTPKPSQLAEGISTALITTLVGLWLAIPAILVYGILKNRLSRLVLEVGILSENLMSRFQTLGKK